MRRFHLLLTLFAVVSLSGIHLAFMQAGAWASMLSHRDLSGDARPFSRLIGDYLASEEVCDRCLITMRAGLESHDGSDDPQRPTLSNASEFRLIPAESQRISLSPPGPVRLPVGPRSDLPPSQVERVPGCPPPERAA